MAAVTFSNSPALSVARSPLSFTRRALAWFVARQTRTALSRLSDRELEDIGLCRGDIAHIARKAARA